MNVGTVQRLFKEELIMSDYGRKLEKEYRDGMVINAIYDFIGKGTNGWKRGHRLASFMGAGESLQLVFENLDTGIPYYIHASDIGGFSLISKPKKPVEDSFFFDKEMFLKYTNDEMFFKIKLDSKVYDCLIMLDSSGDDYLHFAYSDTESINSGTMCLTAYGLCYTKEGDGELKCAWYSDQFEIMTYFDSKIPLSDLFKKKEKPSEPMKLVKMGEVLEWDLLRIKAGKAYLIRIPETGNEIYGIYRFLHAAIPDQSSIVFSVVSDKGKVDTYHVYQEDLVSGKIEIYELAVKKGYDE